MEGQAVTAGSRRALELLAQRRNGCSEALMLSLGFPAALLVELVRDGLATATLKRMMAGDRAIDVTQVQITRAGRKALAG